MFPSKQPSSKQGKRESCGSKGSGASSKRKRTSLTPAQKRKKHCRSPSETQSASEGDQLHSATERKECGGHGSAKASGSDGKATRKRRADTPYCTHLPHPQEKSLRERGSENVEDEEGHLICQSGDRLSARYEVVATLGTGAFGKVVECIDHEDHNRHVAVKIIKNVPTCTEAAHLEVQVLQHLKAVDPNGRYHCVRMLEWFTYRDHVCIVFELLGLSTYDFLKQNGFLPFELDHIRQMAYQICESVNFLHLKKLTHTDLKPENIVFVNSDYVKKYSHKWKCNERTIKDPAVKVVDFGNAVYDAEYHSSLVSTRYYRAPEVILGLGWSQPCDVWSIGCVLVEYYTGSTLFDARRDEEQLAMMERVLGPLPDDMAKRSRKRRYFSHDRLDWDQRSPAARYMLSQCKPLKEFMTCQDADHQNLFDLLGKMLEYDPAKRITLEEALTHPFFFPLERRTAPPPKKAGIFCLPPKKRRQY
ncbi:dual specificity protein kinase CLK1-like isoform X1 [Colius striatus]|nr:dual specificity protein kinase CLK1-like isoform X1 [Colius striatus]XP_061858145.1 dual specificity protein kinase CLK1-like isoform X1 [Colius striatus]